MGFVNSILAGVTLVRQAIQSLGFVSGSTGWRIERDGDAEFNDAIIRGTVVVGSDPGQHIVIDPTLTAENIPAIALFTGDADEQGPGYLLNDPVTSDGSLEMRILSSDRDDSTAIAEIDIRTGTDASPNATIIELLAETINIGNSVYAAFFSTTEFNVDGQLIFTPATSLLEINATPVRIRKGVQYVTANSANITTTETIVQTVTAPLRNGYRYRIETFFKWFSTVAADDVAIRIRENNATGTQLFGSTQDNRLASIENLCSACVEFLAVATGNKTFVVTLQRTVGTGNVSLRAAATSPSILSVDLVDSF